MFVLKLKEHKKHVKTSFHSNFEIAYCKTKAKCKGKKVLFLEKKLKDREQNINSEETKLQY